MKRRLMLLLILSIGIALPVATQSISVRIDPIEAVEELAATEEPLSLETFMRYAFRSFRAAVEPPGSEDPGPHRGSPGAFE